MDLADGPTLPPGEEFDTIRKSLAKAVLHFQNEFLRSDFNKGSLCQVWLPHPGEDGPVLRTKGLPFCVAGVGDLLALFRCISCRYCFGTNIDKPDLLGAPGRVFATMEPEMSRNVQKYGKDVYLRASEAQQCRVHSTLVIPLFADAERSSAVGALEVVQTCDDMPFAAVVKALSSVLEGCQLYTCKLGSTHTKEMSAASVTVRALRDRDSSRSASQKADSSGASGGSERPGPARPDADEGCSGISAPGAPAAPVAEEAFPEGVRVRIKRPQKRSAAGDSGADGHGSSIDAADAAAISEAMHDDEPIAPRRRDRSAVLRRARAASMAADVAATLQQQTLRPAAQQPDSDGGSDEDVEGDEEDDDDDDDDEKGRRRGRGSGNPGKPGKRLRLEDLQGQFGVGLKEAANRLGICPTTLKRACRRHGIQRWPRRQLVKLSRAIDQINASGAPVLAGIAAEPQLNGGAGGAAMQQPPPGPDTRWTTLTQLIPGIAQTGAALGRANSGLLTSSGGAAFMEAQASAGMPAPRARSTGNAASLRGSPGSTTTLSSAAEDAPARGSYADLRSAHHASVAADAHFRYDGSGGLNGHPPVSAGAMPPNSAAGSPMRGLPALPYPPAPHSQAAPAFAGGAMGGYANPTKFIFSGGLGDPCALQPRRAGSGGAGAALAGSAFPGMQPAVLLPDWHAGHMDHGGFHDAALMGGAYSFSLPLAGHGQVQHTTAYGSSALVGDKASMMASAVEPMDFFGGSDGLDDDVGLVDADVFDMLLALPSPAGWVLGVLAGIRP
ncbi:hypothetical protein WJX81_004617 [Elliptochloris bilobata]|uniref:RWP-RK domain-containing protein n=1 Tax=Elliptochloris bilobata TaxID=381761 RepID=A0AAW1S4Y7_9CHLO